MYPCLMAIVSKEVKILFMNYTTRTARLTATAHEELPLGLLKNFNIKIYTELQISSWLRMVKPTELNISEFRNLNINYH